MAGQLTEADKKRFELCAARSNSILLSSEEFSVVQSLIRNEENEVAKIEEEIRKLKVQKTEHLSNVHRLRACIAPHKRLPPEVLICIFSRLISPRRETSDVSTVLHLEKIKEYNGWVLRQVCSTWRHVALNYGGLWNHVTVVPPLGHAYDENDDWGWQRWRKLWRKAEVVFPLTGPVSMHIDTHLAPEDAAELLADNAIQRLVKPFARRLEVLRLTSPLNGVLGLFSPSSRKVYPLLQSLELVMRGGAVGDVDIEELAAYSTTTFFEKAPNLSNLVLDSGDPSLFLTYFSKKIPWSQLRKLELGAVRLQGGQVVPILQHCHRLRHLHLTLDDQDAYQTRESIELPALRSLNLDIAVESIINLLFVPSLKKIIIFREDIPLPVDELVDMITRSRCSIEVFFDDTSDHSLNRYRSSSTLRKLFKALPDLKELRTPMRFSERQMQRISSKEHLPSLEVLGKP